MLTFYPFSSPSNTRQLPGASSSESDSPASDHGGAMVFRRSDYRATTFQIPYSGPQALPSPPTPPSEALTALPDCTTAPMLEEPGSSSLLPAIESAALAGPQFDSARQYQPPDESKKDDELKKELEVGDHHDQSFEFNGNVSIPTRSSGRKPPRKSDREAIVSQKNVRIRTRSETIPLNLPGGTSRESSEWLTGETLMETIKAAEAPASSYQPTGTLAFRTAKVYKIRATSFIATWYHSCGPAITEPPEPEASDPVQAGHLFLHHQDGSSEPQMWLRTRDNLHWKSVSLGHIRVLNGVPYFLSFDQRSNTPKWVKKRTYQSARPLVEATSAENLG
ncbi:hypothetical protein B0H11DRAFT_1905084 [Mycena galericulata]|nr:hypothetical protein B0H11DRAFT_1905084 [Mycena galericulata]